MNIWFVFFVAITQSKMKTNQPPVSSRKKYIKIDVADTTNDHFDINSTDFHIKIGFQSH